MKRRAFLGLTTAGVLAGCGGFRESGMNPRNWFGRSRSQRREQAAAPEPEVNPLIPEQEEGGLIQAIRRRQKNAPYAGKLVAEVTALDIERASGGAIIRARGLAAQQEVHDVRLVPENEDGEPVGGALIYELRAVHAPQTAGTPVQPREVQAAEFASDKMLKNVREIHVRGLRNVRVSRR